MTIIQIGLVDTTGAIDVSLVQAVAAALKCMYVNCHDTGMCRPLCRTWESEEDLCGCVAGATRCVVAEERAASISTNTINLMPRLLRRLTMTAGV